MGAVRRSLMTGSVYGRDEIDYKTRLEGRDPNGLAERGIIHGSADAAVEQLGRFAEAGVQRIMVQWLDLDDMAGLEDFAAKVLPQIHRS